MSSSRGRRIALAAGAVAVAGGAAWLASRAQRARWAEEPLVPGFAPGRAHTVTSPDGAEIHVEEFGVSDGPALVLVHAWMCSHELWHRQITALAGEARVITFDLRGHGRSGFAPTLDYSIEAFADDLGAVLADRLGDGEKAVLAGHSMGAMTIAAWAHAHHASVPARCAGVAMIGTGLGDLITENLVIRAPGRFTGARERIEVALLSTEIPFDGAPEPALRAAVRWVAMGPGARDEDVALVARMVRACPRRVRGLSGGTLSRMNVYDGLAHLDVPATVIAGASDRMTPPVHSHKLAAKLPRSPEVIEVPGSGHMVPLEADGVVSAELRRLLAEAKPGRRRRRSKAVSG
jgi:pimeloyl-ACP methyl ester carboxylesterase